MINKDNYKEYIDRFLSAETTLAEETEMYAWFSGSDLPPEAEKWREMFGWYDSLQPRELPAAKPRSKRLTRVLRWCSAAASVAVLVVLGVIAARSAMHTDINPEYLAYEGSYIVRDGVKITDLSIVVPAILKRECELNRQIEMMDKLMDDFDNEVEARLTMPEIDILSDNTEPY
ncbi:MAG: hypothetical protein NC339_08955 [Muribaculaceae bacterium]|nr:hypothetical protein [Muribaculaceae bacterium]